MANNLRVAVMLANDMIYREENRNEYRAGIELLAVARNERECVWVQIGQPHVMLDRGHLDLISLGASNDLSVQHSTERSVMPPLPQNLLGAASTSNFMVQSLSLQEGDRLILLGRTLVPPALLVTPAVERDLANMSSLLARHSAEMPFWLGVLEL